MKTVLISIGTSLIVSLITFILGLKSGKNQADRAYLQKIYKNLYSHFHDIELALLDGRPKEWHDYKKIETMHSIKYYPMVKELDRSGDILYLKDKIAKDALLLEQECLHYPYDADDAITHIHQLILQNPHFFKGGLVSDSYQKSDNKSRIKTSNESNCNTYHPESYLLFLDKKAISKHISLWATSNPDYALAFTTRGNPPKFSFTIYPNDLLITSDEFIEYIWTSENSSSYIKLNQTKDDLLKRITKIKKQLAKRAKNPNTFWETFFGAFGDLFK